MYNFKSKEDMITKRGRHSKEENFVTEKIGLGLTKYGIRVAPIGRVCAQKGCNTILTRYNISRFCFRCQHKITNKPTKTYKG